MRANSRSGLTLLEVMVALTLLGIGAAAWAAMLGQSAYATRNTWAIEHDVHSASGELSRLSLLSRDELLSQRGTHGLRVVVSDAGDGVLQVAVLDSMSRPLLTTSFYRRGPRAN